MSSLAADLTAILAGVRRPGDFFVSGTAELRAPSLQVEGVGPVALPLLPVQAAQLAAVAEPAPYGRGEETVLDPAVRRSWQIGPEQVRLGGKGWATTLEGILARVADGLGVEAPITASLHKLLLYEAGGFFLGHRDTEKLPGMFGTLVIVLPSLFAGGELVIRHQDRSVRLDLHRDDPAEAGFAAFYADCVHEVLPLTEGSRLTLVYNLVRPGRGKPPQPPGYAREQARMTALLQAWRNAPDGTPAKLIHLLEHAYTPAELGFPTLKGVDAAVAGVVRAAATQAGCDVHLALLTIEESGIAEYSGSWRRHRDDDNDDDFEAGEVCDRSVTLSEWRGADDGTRISGTIPAEDDEFAPPGALEDLSPDKEQFHGPTGNEGSSFERTYRRATLVLWPADRCFRVLSQGGLRATLPYLDELAGSWAASAPDARPALAAEAHDLAGHMIARWPRGGWSPYREEEEPSSSREPSEATRMLTLLARLGDAAAIERFLREVTVSGCYAAADNAAIAAALDRLPPARASQLAEAIVTGTAATLPAACAGLLARLGPTWSKQRRGALTNAAARLVATLPGEPVRNPANPAWPARVPTVKPGFVVDLLTGLDAIDAALAGRAAVHVLAWPVPYGLDAILVPALRQLAEAGDRLDTPARAQLRTAAVAHLRARAALPLAPPADWRRESTLACRCAHCQDLAGFLDDPARKSWVFKAAEALRGHIADTIRKAGSDVDTATDQRGRPYTLVCTKTQASYQRRAKQRQQDPKDLNLLAG